ILTMSVRRNVLNVVRNYSDAEIKVREATSNDPWGPSSSLMSEISDMTYNVVAFSEIMTMIWKRVNDHGKNWRHVYKSLVLLDYLIKTGSERVAQQCKENIFAIQTLKDFQFIDRDVKDQGSNVREKSKQLVNLLKDDERLKTERERALKAKERFAQATTGIGSDHKVVYGHGSTTPAQRGTPEFHSTTHTRDAPKLAPDIEQVRTLKFNILPLLCLPHTHTFCSQSIQSQYLHIWCDSLMVFSSVKQARPQTAGEEELQLQIALSMSKEEAETDQKKAVSDNVRLELAITESVKSEPPAQKSNLVDLTAAAQSLKDPWGGSPDTARAAPVDPFASLSTQPSTVDPWAVPTSAPAADPWAVSAPAQQVDPWSNPPATKVGLKLIEYPFRLDAAAVPAASFDPFASLDPPPASTAPVGGVKVFDPMTVPSSSSNSKPFDFSSMDNSLLQSNSDVSSSSVKPKKRAEDFLGGASDLVNLDSLVTRPPVQQQSVNPFLSGSSPYHQPAQNPPSLNQMKGINGNAGPAMGTTIAAPTMPPGGMMPMTQPVNPINPYGYPAPMQPTYGMPMMGGMNPGMMGIPQQQPVMGGMPNTMQAGGSIGMQSSKNPFL
uniref:ENTH domain-containing protein n=1 Tax=Ciona savignyi TaxID=51511 RepID=H2ZDS8_CIOSA